jgi:ABC-type Fe3+ transport system permease subunit
LIRRLITLLVPLTGWAIIAAALVWPVLALVGRCVTEPPPADGLSFGTRQVVLLARTVGMASLAVALSLLISVPAAYALSRRGSLLGHPFATAMTSAVVLCVPMVYVFGWQKLAALIRLIGAPSGVSSVAGGGGWGVPPWPPFVSCIAAWSMWAWPIPALLLAAAWTRSARGPFESACLEASPFSAFIRIGVPSLVHPIALASGILGLLFLGEYSVPHALGQVVYSTALLASAEQTSGFLETGWVSLPGIAVAGVLMIVVWSLLHRARHIASEVPLATASARAGLRGRVALVMILLITWALPMLGLLLRMGSPSSLPESLAVYGWAIVITLVICTGSAAAVVVLGLSGGLLGRWWWGVAVVALVLGAMPGALVGKAMIAAYLGAPLVYDHWPILVLTGAARYAWVGLVAAAVLRAALPRDVRDHALLDGASPVERMLRIEMPMHAPVLLAVGAIVVALLIGDVSATSLVQVPSVRLVGHVIIEKYHRFEDGMLVSLSLWIVVGAWGAALACMVAGRRWWRS